jgi:hypothetical protein
MREEARAGIMRRWMTTLSIGDPCGGTRLLFYGATSFETDYTTTTFIISETYVG